MASSKLISPALRAALNLHSSKLPAATSQLASAHLSSAPSGGKHELPGLKYDYGALERKLDIRFCYIKIRFMSFIRVMVSGFCSLIRCDDAFKIRMRALRREILLWQLENSTQICDLTLNPMNWKSSAVAFRQTSSMDTYLTFLHLFIISHHLRRNNDDPSYQTSSNLCHQSKRHPRKTRRRQFHRWCLIHHCTLQRIKIQWRRWWNIC